MDAKQQNAVGFNMHIIMNLSKFCEFLLVQISGRQTSTSLQTVQTVSLQYRLYILFKFATKTGFQRGQISSIKYSWANSRYFVPP